MPVKQNYINHIALVLDASGSMDHLSSAVVKVADNQVGHLAQRSKELDQETRATVYTFSDAAECVYYDKDVLRMPSLKGAYSIGGSTALIDATIQAIDDLSQTPELYGDHAFLVYVLTDGEENRSRKKAADLAKKIGGLKDNWTIACFVPDQSGKFEAKKFGFPTDNIAVWDTSSRGMSEVAEVLRTTTDTFMNNRAKGVRGTKNLFNIDLAGVTKTSVAKSLNRLHPGQYRIADVKAEGPIAPFVEGLTKRAYKLGEAYYQLSKPEKVQAGKSVALYEVSSKAVYTGNEARSLLGLPDHEVKVAPSSHPDFWIFVQSTSVNRKLMQGTKLLILS
jgi:hypothetical protein